MDWEIKDLLSELLLKNDHAGMIDSAIRDKIII
jgi:hypothetical protein